MNMKGLDMATNHVTFDEIKELGDRAQASRQPNQAIVLYALAAVVRDAPGFLQLFAKHVSNGAMAIVRDAPPKRGGPPCT
jgi:hypothetical protein